MKNFSTLLVALTLAFVPSAHAVSKLVVDSATAGPCGVDVRFYSVGQQITLKAAGLSPNTSGTIDYRNQLETVVLGTFQTDASGNLDIQVAVPATITTPSIGALRGLFATETLVSDLIGVGTASDCNLPPLSTCTDWDADGICDDVDGCPEFPGPTCPTGPECGDGVDNDHDGTTDFGVSATNDPGCTSAGDASEKEAGMACDDGIDNDNDDGTDVQGYLVDTPPFGIQFVRSATDSDPACQSPSSPKEDTQCDNNLDDDGDLAYDWDGNMGLKPTDPECAFAGWDNEAVPEPSAFALVLASLASLGCLSRFR